MVVNFPNSSRSYDVTRRAVRFWGHHSAMESSFFLTEQGLKRLHPGIAIDEAAALRVFDANRDAIYAAAVKVFDRGRKGSYDLVGSDL